MSIPVPRPLMVLELACSPRLPDRAEMAGMKLTIRVYALITSQSRKFWPQTM